VAGVFPQRNVGLEVNLSLSRQAKVQENSQRQPNLPYAVEQEIVPRARGRRQCRRQEAAPKHRGGGRGRIDRFGGLGAFLLFYLFGIGCLCFLRCQSFAQLWVFN